MNQNASIFLSTKADYFPAQMLPAIRQTLSECSDDAVEQLMLTPLQSPTMVLIVSILAGTLGIDRFMIGDVGLGIGKLLTGGGCGIWTIIDWFLIGDRTREANYKKLMVRLLFLGGKPA